MSKGILLLVGCLAIWPGFLAPSTAQPAPLKARQESFVGSRQAAHRGVLEAEEDGIRFIANHTKYIRKWTFDEIRQLRVDKTRRVTLEIYRSGGNGHGRTVKYNTDAPVPPDWVAFVLARAPRPVVTAVIPTRTLPARFTVAVNHEGTDAEGDLVLYADGLAFETSRPGFARFWRFADLDTVLLQDRYRLLVAAYEGPREHVRPFLFTLKHDLPPEAYAQLWQQINGRHQQP